MIRKFVFYLLFLLACAPSPQTLQTYSNIKVTEVIDGDTVRLQNGKLLRYIGIDTPEMRTKEGSAFIYSPQPFAKEALEYNQRLVEGKFVRVEFDVETNDKYGRLLGYCFVGDTFVNAALIKEGVAVIYTRPPNVKYTDLLVSCQKTARENKKGLWGSYEVITPAQAGEYINQIRVVKGKVISTYKSKSCVFLNFGYNYKTDFTAVIFSNSFNSFYDKGIDPLTFYKGKVIAVSGRIREYNGPEIIVNSPEEIELID